MLQWIQSQLTNEKDILSESHPCTIRSHISSQFRRVHPGGKRTRTSSMIPVLVHIAAWSWCRYILSWATSKSENFSFENCARVSWRYELLNMQMSCIECKVVKLFWLVIALQENKTEKFDRNEKKLQEFSVYVLFPRSLCILFLAKFSPSAKPAMLFVSAQKIHESFLKVWLSG